MKVGYKTLMRFYSDIPDATEVVWYPVPEDTPFLPYPTVFFDWDWVEENPPGKRAPGGVSLGEQITAPRTYPGRPRPSRTFFSGRICGTPQQWLNGDGLPVVPPTPYADGFPHCCGRASVPFWDINSCPDLAKMAECTSRQYQNNALVMDFLIAEFGNIWTQLYSVDNNATLMPGMLCASNEDWTIVVISGTTHFNQYVRQTLGSLSMARATTPDGSGYSTSAFYETIARTMYTFLLPLVGVGRRLLVIGHSFGGAMAQMLALKLADSPAQSHCYVATFGAPRAGDFRFVQLVRGLVVGCNNIINDGDPVPRLPPWVNGTVQALFPLAAWGIWQQWADGSNRVGLRLNGSMYANPDSYLTIAAYIDILTRLAGTADYTPFAAHSPAEYQRRLEFLNCEGVGPALGLRVALFADEFAGGPSQVVSTWTDQSGNGNDMVYSGVGFTRPSVNSSAFPYGMPLIDFKSTSRMHIPTLTLDGAFSLCIQIGLDYTFIPSYTSRAAPFLLDFFTLPQFASGFIDPLGANVEVADVTNTFFVGSSNVLHNFVIVKDVYGYVKIFLDGDPLPGFPDQWYQGDPLQVYTDPYLTVSSGWNVTPSNKAMPVNLLVLYNEYIPPGDDRFPYYGPVP